MSARAFPGVLAVLTVLISSSANAQEARGTLQPLLGAAQRLRVAERGEEDLRVSKVRGHFDPGERNQADARVLELDVQQPRQLALDLIGDPPQPLLVGHEKG